MSRTSLDEELNIDSQQYNVRDILAEYWMQAAEETPSVPSSGSLPRGSAGAPRASSGEESVRIYEPRRDRAEPDARSASLLDQEAAPKRSEQAPSASEASAPLSLQGSVRELADSFAGFFRRDRRTGPASRAKKPVPEELPSFDELLWGKKEVPVRIEEEDDEALSARESAERPTHSPLPEAPRHIPEKGPEFEVRIPEGDLADLSVNAILAEYWNGLEEKPAPNTARICFNISPTA